MNAEGAKRKIFQHSEDWIERVGVIVVQLHDQFLPGCADAFDQATASYRRVTRTGMTGLAIRHTLSGPAAEPLSGLGRLANNGWHRRGSDGSSKSSDRYRRSSASFWRTMFSARSRDRATCQPPASSSAS